MRNRYLMLMMATAVLSTVPLGARQKAGKKKLSPIDRYLREATAQAAAKHGMGGSLYTPNGLLGDVARDLQARQVNDMVTIVVADRASAVSRGSTSTGRKSSANASVDSLYGPRAGKLVNLASLGGQQQLAGQGETAREMVLTTTISARVTHVLPNGYLVVEGDKDIWINSEHQQISVRGVVRWNDISAGNQVSSDRLAELEIHVNGKGVVGDAIRRPNFFYRLLLGLLPF